MILQMRTRKKLWNPALAVVSLAMASKAFAVPAGVAGLSFDDEFTGNSLNLSNWGYRYLGVRNSATNIQNAVAVANGDLTITTYTSGGTNYTGMIGTQGLFQQAYGYFEASISFSDSPGGWSAFWVQSPTEGTPVNNPQVAGVEMDIVEHRDVDSSNDSVASEYDSALHWDGYGTDEQNASTYVTPPITPGSWNTYGMLWTPTGYTFYFNGTPEWTQTSPTTPASAAAEYIILSSEVDNGSWAGDVPTNGYGALNTSTTKMTVDYVHAYALANVYTPTSASTDTWTAGSNWNFAPVSGSSTELTFVDTTGTTTLAGGLANTNTNNATSLVQANIVDLGGAGPASGSPASITINSLGPGLSLVADSLSGANPVINLVAMRGTQGLTYTVNSPIVLANGTTFQGNGTANFTFASQISGAGLFTKTGTSLLTLSGHNTYSGGTNISSGAVLVTNSSSLGTGPIAILNGGTSTASLQLSGGITITNSFAGFSSEVGGNTPTIENISGNNTVTASLSITTTGGNGAIFQSDAGTLNLSGGLSTTLPSSRIYYLQGAGNGQVLGNISDSSANILQVQKSGTGTWALAGSDDTYAAGTTVNAGTLIFDSPGAFPLFSRLIIDATAVAAQHVGSANNTLFTSSLSLAGATNNWTGTLDLTDNDLVVRNGSLGTLTAQVRQGYNLAGGGDWQGSGGILSSAAASNTTHLTALGVIQNSANGTATGTPLFTTFDGQSVFNVDVLVKYTYYGDTNLDGKIDGTDYSRIDNGYLTHATGWYNGDFNYDGVIDGSDYTLIDNAFNTQGAQLTASIAGPSAEPTAETAENSAVPEPSAIGWIGTAVIGSLARRRRNRSASRSG